MRQAIRWTTVVAAAAVLAGCGGAATPKPHPDPKVAVATHVRTAQAYLAGGRNVEALDELRAAMKIEPENAGLPNFAGQIFLLTGRYPEAEAELKRALTLDPQLADAHNNLGVLYDRMGRPTEAEEEFKKAVSFFDQDARYQYFLGLSRLQQKTKAKQSAAFYDFEQGARLEAANRPHRTVVNASLERVQGELRQTLNGFRQK